MNSKLKKYLIPAAVAALCIVGVVAALIVIQNRRPDMVQVTLIAEGSQPGTVEVEKGSTLSTYPAAAREGYAFVGWYMDEAYTTPWYLEDPIVEDITVYAQFQEIEPEFVEYEAHEMFLDDRPTDYVVNILSDTAMSTIDLLERITIETKFGDTPEFTVGRDQGIYMLFALNGYQPGGYYTVTLPEGMHFMDMDENIDTLSFRIHKEEVQIVELSSGIKYIDRNDVGWQADNKAFVIPSVIASANKLAVGDVLCVGDGVQSFDGDFIFVNIVGVSEPVQGLTYVNVADSDVSDVYDDVDIYVKQALSSEDVGEMIDLAALEKSMYDSECLLDLTRILTYAVNSNITYNSLIYMSGEHDGAAISTGATGFDQYNFANNVSPRTDLVEGDFEDLLGGVSITVSTAMADNANFSIPDPNNWTYLSIKFTYETTLRHTVKIYAELELRECLNVSAQGYLQHDKGLNDLEFDYALNFYSQTDMFGTILICSTSLENEAKGDEWINITDEINDLISGDSDSDTDTLVARMKEMLDEKGDYVKLLEVPIVWVKIPIPPIIPVFQVNIEVNLVVRVNFAAGLSSSMSILNATQVGIRGTTRDKRIEGYSNDLAEGGRYSYSLAACGYIGLRAGVEGKLMLSFAGLDQFGEIGAAIEVGAYTDLYGYTDVSIIKRTSKGHTDVRVRGGYYMEVGIYGSLMLIAEAKAFKAEAELTLADIQIPLFTLGNRYLLLSLDAQNGTYYMHDDTAKLTDIIPLAGEFLDLTTGEIEHDVLPKDVKLQAMFTQRGFRYDAGSGVIAVRKDDIGRRLTAETAVCLYYSGPNLIFAETSNIDGNYAYVGMYTIRWISPDSDISEEDFGKLIVARYFLDPGDEPVQIGEREFEIGTVPGAWEYTEGEYTAYYDWDTDPWEPADKQTDYTMHGSSRYVLVGYVWYEDDVWKTEIRAMSVGSVPEFPAGAESCEYAKLKGWSLQYGVNVRDELREAVGLIQQPAMIPFDCFNGLTYLKIPVGQGELMYTNEALSQHNSWISFMGVPFYTADGGRYDRNSLYALYIADYSFEKFNVTFASVGNSGLETVPYTEVQTVTGGDQPATPHYLTQYGRRFAGWDYTGDGIADCTNADLPRIKADTAFVAVYDEHKITVTGMIYDAAQDSYVSQQYTVAERAIISSDILHALSTPLNTSEAIEPSFRYWEITCGGQRTTQKSLLVFAKEDMVIKPVFQTLVKVSFDPGKGAIAGYKRENRYVRGLSIVLPEAVIVGDEDYARAVNTSWSCSNGVSYRPGDELQVTAPMTFTAEYELKEREYIVDVRVGSEQGVLPNGGKTDSYRGDREGYLAFIAQYEAYSPETFYSGGLNYYYHPEQTVRMTNITDDTTEVSLVLHWNGTPAVCTITLDAGEGEFTYAGANKTVTDQKFYGSTLDLGYFLSIEPCEKQDEYYSYRLTGWVAEDGTIYGPSAEYRVTGDATLTAVWEKDKPQQYKITYVLDGKEVETAMCGYGEQLTPAGRPSRAAGKAWSGWTWYDGDRELSSAPAKMPAHDLRAVSESGIVTITYLLILTDGTEYVYSVQEGYVGRKTAVLPKYAQSKYRITAWSSKEVKVTDGSFIMPEQDVTFTSTMTYAPDPTPVLSPEEREYTITVKVNGASVYSDTACAGDYVYLQSFVAGTAYDGMYIEWSVSPSVSMDRDDMGRDYFIMPASSVRVTGHTE